MVGWLKIAKLALKLIHAYMNDFVVSANVNLGQKKKEKERGNLVRMYSYDYITRMSVVQLVTGTWSVTLLCLQPQCFIFQNIIIHMF